MNPAPAGGQICSQADLKQEGKPSLAGTWLVCLFHKPNFISLVGNAGGMISVIAESPLPNQR